MTLQAGDEIGEEVHEDIDQFFRVEEGRGTIYIDGLANPIEDDFAAIVPQEHATMSSTVATSR